MLDNAQDKAPQSTMEKFTNDIYGVYELINESKNTKSIINTTIISKQYLAYYLYRIITNQRHMAKHRSQEAGQ